MCCTRSPNQSKDSLMSKAKQLIRSIRFKYNNPANRASRYSNCILLTIFLFVVAVLFLAQKRNLEDEYSYSFDLDDFQAANYEKAPHKVTTKVISSKSKRNTDITLKTTAIARVSRAKSVNTESNVKFAGFDLDLVRPRFPLLLIPKSQPKIKTFYRGKYPLRTKAITPKVKPCTTKKLTYRDVFYAMAHPRTFPTTPVAFERAENAHVKTGMNDWIQANSHEDKDKFLVYSAYWDDRFDGNNFVRVMSMMVTKNSPTVYCRLQMEDETFNEVPTSKKIMNEHWRLRYASFFVSCEVSKNLQPPAKVFLSLNRNFTFSAMLPVYQNRKNRVSPRGEMAVCVKPLHYYYDRATWLVEFIELHRILGVDHFFFYNHSVGENVDRLLRRYIKENIVTVLPWNLPVQSQKEIRTEGIFSSLNDCVYRTMYLFHYVILLDFDEYIIPREHDNYLEMLEKIEEDNNRIRGKPGSFVFRNTFFYLYWENDTAAYGVEPEKPPQWMPYFVTQYKTRRLTTSMKVGSRSKYIVVPDRVVEVGNHVVWRHVSGSRAIPVQDSVALLHHYRICEFGGFSCLKKPSLVDRMANKFSEELLRRAFDQCQKTYPELEGKCPLSPPLGSPW